MPTFFIGIDVGTSGTKAVLIDSDGVSIATSSGSYPMHHPRPMWVDQDPHDWWDAASTAVKDLLEKTGTDNADVGAVGLTGQMHGMVLLDGDGEVIRPAILWNDQRTEKQCRDITEKIGAKEVLRRLGNPVLTGFTAPKVLWVCENEPEAFSRVASLLLPKAYVRYRLTGTRAEDVSDASGTSLFNVGHRAWDDDMLRDLDIPSSWLPEVFESAEVCATVSREGAAATGLLEGTPVVAGAGDNAAQAVGSGVVDEGTVSATLGTSGVVFATSDTYRLEPEGRLHAFCHAVPGKWHLMGVVLSAAGSFEWYSQQFGDPSNPDNYSDLIDAAAGVPAGSDGLVFLPYLSGERTPHQDANARGVWFGATLAHTKAHFTRSLLEGVSFAMTDSVELMRGLGVPTTDLRVAGGGAKSGLWLQMLADCFNAPLRSIKPGEGAAYGAALLGAVGGGAFSSVEEAGRRVSPDGELVSPSDKGSVYAESHRKFKALYPALKDLY